MRSTSGLGGGVFVFPRKTPLRSGFVRYLFPGMSGGHTSRIGDAERPDAHTCLTKRGTSRVRGGGEDERSPAALALAVERSVTAPTAIAPLLPAHAHARKASTPVEQRLATGPGQG